LIDASANNGASRFFAASHGTSAWSRPRSGRYRRARVGDAARHADADQVGGQRIEAGGLGVEGEAPGLARVGDEGRQVGERQDAVGRVRGARRLGLRREEPRTAEIELGERRFIAAERAVDAEGIERRQVGHVGELDQAAGQLGLGLERLDVLALLALELIAVGQHRGEVAVLLEQLGRGLRADAGDAGNVVGAVADHAQVIDHLLRRDALLLQQFLGAAQDVLARIPGADAVVQELVDVLVLGAQAHIHAGGARLFRQGREHIVGLVARDLEDRHPARAQDLLDIVELCRQQVRHRVAMGLVLGEDLAAEAVADVEHAHQVRQQRILPQIAHQIGKRIRHAGRPPAGTGERRHAEEELVGVVVAVDGHQRFSRHQTPEMNGY
jgi:hypothetical protein